MASPKVIAAAHAAASWARARRATWTDIPLPPPLKLNAPPIEPLEPQLESLAVSITPAVHEYEEIAQENGGAVPVSDVAERPRWMAVAVVIALAALTAGGVFAWKARSAAREPTAPPASSSAAATSASGAGRLTVASEPAGAKVTVDNTARGETPLTLVDVPAGRHVILIEGPAGSLERTVTVQVGEETVINEAIFSGWVAIFAPFEVSVAEGERLLRLDERGQILLPPGPHDLTIANEARGFSTSRHVVIKPGEITRLSIVP